MHFNNSTRRVNVSQEADQYQSVTKGENVKSSVMIVLLAMFVGAPSFAAEFTLGCSYYAKSKSGKDVADSGEIKKTFITTYEGQTPDLVGSIDFTTKDKRFHFSIIDGDEGSEFIVVKNLKTKKTALTYINVSDIDFDKQDEEGIVLGNVMLSEREFDPSEGFWGATAGMICVISRK